MRPTPGCGAGVLPGGLLFQGGRQSGDASLAAWLRDGGGLEKGCFARCCFLMSKGKNTLFSAGGFDVIPCLSARCGLARLWNEFHNSLRGFINPQLLECRHFVTPDFQASLESSLKQLSACCPSDRRGWQTKFQMLGFYLPCLAWGKGQAGCRHCWGGARPAPGSSFLPKAADPGQPHGFDSHRHPISAAIPKLGVLRHAAAVVCTLPAHFQFNAGCYLILRSCLCLCCCDA